MKIAQSRDYKKPLYALGISAALLATTVTGCGNPAGKDPSPTKGSGTRTMSEFYSKYDADKEIALGGDVYIEGEASGPVDYEGEETICTEVGLDGDVSVDYTDNNNNNDKVILDGGAPIDEG